MLLIKKKINGETIKFHLANGFNGKHITNGMNAEKVYEIGKQRCERESNISMNTLIVNESIISNYIQSTNFKLKYLNNNEFSFSIGTSGDEAMIYIHSPNRGVKRCDLVVVSGKIQPYGHIITHLDNTTQATGDIIYNEDNYQNDLDREVQRRQKEQAERAEQNRATEATEAYNQRRAEVLENYRTEINDLMNGEYQYTEEEAIQELMYR